LRPFSELNPKRRAASAWRFFSSWLMAAAILAGCKNPFSLRTPEKPVTSTGWTPPLRPEEVLVKLQGVGGNAEYFLRCFSDPAFTGRNYRFEPDPETAAAHPEVFGAWSREKEQAVMQQAFYLTPKDSICGLVWTASVREFMASDSAVFVRRYRLELVREQTSHVQDSGWPRIGRRWPSTGGSTTACRFAVLERTKASWEVDSMSAYRWEGEIGCSARVFGSLHLYSQCSRPDFHSAAVSKQEIRTRNALG
jgi:hypothetical protein